MPPPTVDPMRDALQQLQSLERTISAAQVALTAGVDAKRRKVAAKEDGKEDEMKEGAAAEEAHPNAMEDAASALGSVGEALRRLFGRVPEPGGSQETMAASQATAAALDDAMGRTTNAGAA